MTAVDELLDYIFDGKRPVLYPEFAGWVLGSRRFRDFAITHRVKIRAKLRNVRGEESLKDLAAELETAALLLAEPRFTLEYEKYAASKQRGPDFTVTYRTHTPFNVEVRRIRSAEWAGADPSSRSDRLVAVLCDKMGQMPPGIVNLLWLVAGGEAGGLAAADLVQAMGVLRRLAEQKAEGFFARHGCESAAAFLRQYGRLSCIVLRSTGETVPALNSLARHPVPPEIVNALQRL